MARLDVLFDGYGNDDGVAGTVSLLRDGDVTAIVDPGMVPSRASILDPLAALGVDREQVTDIILSHHHPDHTMNIALFPESVTVHDHWATYVRDQWTPRPAEGVQLSRRVDGVVIVIRSASTKQTMVRRVLALLDDAGANVLGSVLNGRKFYIPQVIYDRL